jgi:hypothetical protein
MLAAWVGLGISIVAVAFGAMQLRRGHRTNGRLAIALGAVGIVMNLYAMYAAA